MGSLLFLILKASMDLHSQHDSYWLCLLVSVDSLVGVSAMRIWVYLRGR